jgi:hypothetical protein
MYFETLIHLPILMIFRRKQALTSSSIDNVIKLNDTFRAIDLRLPFSSDRTVRVVGRKSKCVDFVFFEDFSALGACVL